MIKKILAMYISSFLILSPFAWADDEIVKLNQGDTAPFSGTLFSTTAAAKLIVELEYDKEACEIEKRRDLGIQKAELDLKIDILKSKYDACESRHVDLMAIKNDQILFLDTQLKKSVNKNTPLWFAIGVASGVAITMASAWSINQVSNQ